MSEAKDSKFVKAPIRCRRAKCNAHEVDQPFVVCPKCKFAKYCSEECLKADAELHGLMCDPTKLDKIKAESEHEQHPLVKKVMEEKTPDYISAEEVKDEKISDRILDQIQMIVDPFVVCQYQRTKQRGFLFLQSESTLAEFRFTKRKTPEGVPLNRTLICHYVTIEEYIADIVPEHPNESLKDEGLISKLRQTLADYKPEEQFVALCVFGCGTVHMQLRILSPFKLIIEAIKANKERYQYDSLDINIDQD